MFAKRFFYVCAGLFLIALCMAGSAWAHHNAAGIDRTKTVTVEGTVKQFKWANPHAWLEVEVPNPKGGSDLWNFEMTSPTFLVRAGWKSRTSNSTARVSTACCESSSIVRERCQRRIVPTV